jgi:hypothetical protein
MASPSGVFARNPQAERRPRRSGVLAWTCSRLLALSFFASTCAAQSINEAVGTEHAVKAAFIYKFLAYVDWPPDALSEPSAPLVVGVLNEEDVAADLGRLALSKTVNNRMVKVRLLRDGEPLNGLHALYTGNAEYGSLHGLLRAAQARPILTITDAEGALAMGSIINFRIVDNRVRFEISYDAAEKSNLRLSSRLISVAYAVQKGTP